MPTLLQSRLPRLPRLPRLVAATVALLIMTMMVSQSHARFGEAEPTRSEVYKQVGDVKLELFIFEPKGHQANDKRPAIVFFFGGGWNSGTPKQFFKHCEYLASRGMVAMAADYRVKSRHGVTPFECVADAKSAVRYIRKNAGTLGVDPKRIAAGGGSAGGHIAACTGVIDGLDQPGENAAISSKPNAMVLFNPVLDLTPSGWPKPKNPGRVNGLVARFGGHPEKASPQQHIKAGAPPTVVFHGKADTTVPYPQAEAFAKTMADAGNRCVLHGYDGQGHGWFNFGRGGGGPYRVTVRAMDEFLISLGWLKGEPTIK